jgi:hypothetical protein
MYARLGKFGSISEDDLTVFSHHYRDVLAVGLRHESGRDKLTVM